MRIKATKDYSWSIEYKKIDFKKDETSEVEESIAQEMINKGYALLQLDSVDNVIVEEKPSKETLVKENKAVKSSDETKAKKEKKSKA